MPQRVARAALQLDETGGFVYSYLGMSDSRLPVALPDLVERVTVAGYPTNFAPVAAEDLEALTLRGEQLTRHLVDYYCPPLGT